MTDPTKSISTRRFLPPHPTDAVSLVAGLVFLGVVGNWALLETGLLAAASLTWLIPVTLVLAGLVGLLVTWRAERS